jgi:hypothetical protein
LKAGFAFVFHSTSNPAGYEAYVFSRCGKTGQIDFTEKQVKFLLPVCQILRNFTKRNARKFTVSFAFVVMLTS